MGVATQGRYYASAANDSMRRDRLAPAFDWSVTQNVIASDLR